MFLTSTEYPEFVHLERIDCQGLPGSDDAVHYPIRYPKGFAATATHLGVSRRSYLANVVTTLPTPGNPVVAQSLTVQPRIVPGQRQKAPKNRSATGCDEAARNRSTQSYRR